MTNDRAAGLVMAIAPAVATPPAVGAWNNLKPASEPRPDAGIVEPSVFSVGAVHVAVADPVELVHVSVYVLSTRATTVSVPLTGLVPDHEPLAVHAAASVLDHVSTTDAAC